MNVAAWSAEHLRVYGDHVAVCDARQTATFAALHDRGARLATAFQRSGVAPGDDVFIVLENGADLVVAFSAALMCGAVATPVPPTLTADELALAVSEAVPSAVVTSGHLAPTISSGLLQVPRRWVLADHARPGWVAANPLVASCTALERVEPRTDDDAAVACYTGGTTGRAKHVRLTHGAVRARHRPIKRGRARDVVLASSPMSAFGAWLLTERLATPLTLASLVHFDAAAAASAIDRHRVTAVMLVPTMAEALLALPDIDRHDLSSVRHLAVGGAHVPPDLLDRLERLFRVRPVVSYGMTEAGGGITVSGPDSKRGSVGRPLPGVTVRICDDQGGEVPRGAVGEVCVRTPWMGVDSPWLSTGDVGYLDQESELVLVARRKSIVIQGGVNVYPDAVADVIRRLPGVEDCAVVGVSHEVLGEQVVACVVPLSDAKIDGPAVLTHCRLHIERPRMPVRVVFVDALPRTGSGKVSERELKARVPSSPREETALGVQIRSMPSGRRASALEVVVAQQATRLGADPEMGGQRTVTARFSDLGLDSIRLAQLVVLLEETLGWEISPLLPFRHPTPAAFCRAVLVERGLVATTDPVRVRTPRRRVNMAPVAIVGYGCRFPGGADDPDRFWRLLADGIDATQDISRWDMDAVYAVATPHGDVAHVRRASLLEDLEPYAANGVPAAHGLAQTVAGEALQSAGFDRLRVSHVRTGVFLGLSHEVAKRPGSKRPPWEAASTVARVHGLRGPAAIFDTTCSSSLFAAHAAIQALRRRECDLALVGGVSVIESPRSFIGLSRMGVLAADGRSRSFDADAGGFGRGEGAAMFVLRRLDDAVTDGDPAVALIAGSTAGQDGRAATLAAPNRDAQVRIMRHALADVGADAEEIAYLEGHGAGTTVGDPVELDAISEVYGSSTRTLLVGSVKSNLGHCEAAAGAAGLLKTVLALSNKQIPPSLHFQRFPAAVTSDRTRLSVPRVLQPWPDVRSGRRFAAVTSLGMSGTSVHLIVQGIS